MGLHTVRFRKIPCLVAHAATHTPFLLPSRQALGLGCGFSFPFFFLWRPPPSYSPFIHDRLPSPLPPLVRSSY